MFFSEPARIFKHQTFYDSHNYSAFCEKRKATDTVNSKLSIVVSLSKDIILLFIYSTLFTIKW